LIGESKKQSLLFGIDLPANNKGSDAPNNKLGVRNERKDASILIDIAQLLV
jgi:hypothetical protein